MMPSLTADCGGWKVMATVLVLPASTVPCVERDGAWEDIRNFLTKNTPHHSTVKQVVDEVQENVKFLEICTKICPSAFMKKH